MIPIQFPRLVLSSHWLDRSLSAKTFLMRLLVLLFVLLGFVSEGLAYIKGKDGRSTIPRTDAEEAAMRASVRVGHIGKLVMGSGFLVEDRSILVTNYHVLFDLDTDELLSSRPYVQYNPEFDSPRVHLKSRVEQKTDNTVQALLTNSECDKSLDICIVELERGVPGSEPLDFFTSYETAQSFLAKNPKVTLAGFSIEVEAAVLKSFTDGNVPQEYFFDSDVLKVQTCFIRDFGIEFGQMNAFSDCDTRHGNSGSLLVTRNGAGYEVVGITHRLKYDKDKPPSDGDAYDRYLNSTKHRLVSDAILDMFDLVANRVN